jgi:hypothetical protein
VTKVYPLSHTQLPEDDNDHGDPDEDRSWKDIGIYSSRTKAEAAIERLRKMPGFRDFPNGFRIWETTLDVEEAWAEGFISWEEASRPADEKGN